VTAGTLASVVQAAVFRAAAAAATLGAIALAAACTSDSHPSRTLADTHVDHADEARLGGRQPGSSTPVDETALGLALAAVPPSVLYASFTDLTAVKERLRYADVDSSSPAGERFAFWEAARADGTLLTGMRLLEDTSLMADDYGWTGDDVAWEIDFSGNETGCTEDMICDPSGGSVLGLRPDLDTRVVVGSLADNGFEFDAATQFWTTDKPGQPFNRAVYLPHLKALALGNAIGLVRILAVAGGAPSLADQLPSLASALRSSSPESAYIATTGCVSLGEAFGPDASEQDLARYIKASDPSGLADADAWAVAIDSGDVATSYLAFAADGPPPTADEAQLRSAVIDTWHSVQADVAFEEVASAEVIVGGPIETTRFDVIDMPAFAAMVLTHDAPWALCPTSPT
jgi:hypothetical protein